MNYKSLFKKSICVFLLLSIFLQIPMLNTSAEQGEGITFDTEYIIRLLNDPNVVPGEIVVTFKKDINFSLMYETLFNVCQELYPNETREALDKRICCLEGHRFQKITVEPADSLKAILQLMKDNSVFYAEPDLVVTLTEESPEYSFDPGVPAVSSLGQWHLDKINVLDAWDKTFVGSDDIIVAILDTGYTSHSQLTSHMSLDLAYNVYSSSTNYDDTNGHGTFIAGIVGAALDGVGTNGICQNVSIVPVKITNPTTHTSTEYYMSLGVDYAKEIGADVVNISFGLSVTPVFLQSSISSFGKLVVFSAGNAGEQLESSAGNIGKANDEPLWVIVGGTATNANGDDLIYTYSNWSAQYVDIMAPAVDILSTGISSNNYQVKTGTSFAAPMVTAAIALIKAHAPHLTPAEIKSYIINNATVPSGTNPYYGKCVANGYLNISAVIDAIYDEFRGYYTKGDGTGDGYITDADSELARKVVLGTITPTQQQIDALDINNNGSVNTTDYARIRRYTLKTYYFEP